MSASKTRGNDGSGDAAHDLDALLRAWPALDAAGKALPAEGDASWDAKANAIVAAARVATRVGKSDFLAAPRLEPEPGEDGGSASAGDNKRMSSDSDSGAKGASGKPRQSLKEIAQRASQSGRPPPMSSRQSSPGPLSASSTPLPVAVPSPDVAIKRAAEGKSDDSGVVNLKIVQDKATPAQVAAADRAKPGEKSLFDDDAPGSDAKGAKKSAASAPAAVAKAAPAAKGGGGATAGIVIALVGIAAAFAIWQVRKPSATPTATNAPASAAPEVAKSDPKPTPVAAAAPAATATGAAPSGFDPSNLPDPSASAAPSAHAHGGPLPGKEPEAKASAVAVAAAPPPVGVAGDLKSEMRKAVGADGKPLPTDPEPASAADTRSKTLPERPSQGAVQSAIGAVLGAAKACVSGADEATRATVTFNANGSVGNVSVTGWASANGKSSCVVGALKGAKVGAFTDNNYSFPVTIRP